MRKAKKKTEIDERVPLKEYLKLQNKSYGCTGQLTIKLFGHKNKQTFNSVLVRINDGIWAIIAMGKLEVKVDRHGVHIDDASFKHDYQNNKFNGQPGGKFTY